LSLRLDAAPGHGDAPALLGPDDPPPFEVANPRATTPILVVCDHAGRAIPKALGDLGLPAAELERHIAYDVGAEAAARALAEKFQATLLATGYSRLVIDCNRALDDPTSIPQESDGTDIPGNRGLAPADRAARAAAIHAPYHAAIAGHISRLGRPALLSVHSFTPEIQGFRRPWQLGLLWNRDDRIVEPLLASLGREPGLVVGDNEPYTGRDGHGFTTHAHAEPLGLPHILLEIRQDLVADAAGAERWAGLLHAHLAPILAALA
jgi:predicted N-formylglutamate amidohydrolase